MGRKGPCSHCKIENSRFWRPGPEKQVLCNTCGCRWAKKRSLDGYIPRHREIPNYELKQLLSTGNPTLPESNTQNTSNTSSSAPVDQFHWISKVQRKKRSPEPILTTTEHLHKQLLRIAQEEQPAQPSLDYDDDLIYNRKYTMMDSNETLLGAVLLTPPDKE